jgi:hypothetical protein
MINTFDLKIDINFILDVKYSEKNIAKSQGAKWNGKNWYIKSDTIEIREIPFTQFKVKAIETAILDNEKIKKLIIDANEYIEKLNKKRKERLEYNKKRQQELDEIPNDGDCDF